MDDQENLVDHWTMLDTVAVIKMMATGLDRDISSVAVVFVVDLDFVMIVVMFDH